MQGGIARRTFLALLASASAMPALAKPPIGTVYVVGNSFVRRHDVGDMLARLLIRGASLNAVHTRARNNAWLSDHVAKGLIFSDISDLQPRWLILQDHSLAALTESGRKQSTEAVRQIMAATNACPIFLPPWSRIEGHALFAKPGMPVSPADMLARTTAHYDQLVDQFGGFAAPVASGWHTLVTSGFRLHAEDGYHANRAGAWFVAMVLAASLGVDPRWGSPVDLSGLSNLAKLQVLHAAECALPPQPLLGS